MGTCIYCGKPAGWLNRSHPDCEQQHKVAQKRIPEFFKEYMYSDMPANRFGELARRIADEHFVSSQELHSLAIVGFRCAVDDVLEHQITSKDEEAKLVRLQREFGLTQTELGGSIERLVKAAVLRDVEAGVINPRVSVEDLTINLLKDEVVLWLFNNSELYEFKSHTTYVGGSQGISLRIARGVYYRVSAFKGQSLQTEDLERQDSGSFIVTNQNVYFSGPRKSQRVHLKKIVSVQGYSDGIGITREAANPRPLNIKLDDPWFASNLILKLGAM
jgi:hypothetical protein